MKVLFLIRSLDAGGAERQLIELVRHLDRSLFDPLIVTFYDGGLLRDEIREEDRIPVLSLGKSGRWDVFRFLIELNKIVRREKPDLVHGYLDVANLFALGVGKLNHIKVVWGLRASNIDLKNYDWTAEFVFRLSGWLSALADGLIVNSQAGYDYHVRRGFSRKKMVVIHNGIDAELFYPDHDARIKKRAEWGLDEHSLVIGQVGRLDPMKGPEFFIRAAAKVLSEYPGVRFVYVGDGPAVYRRELMALTGSLGLSSSLTWTGLQRDMRAVYNALDVLSLSSVAGEGFPNVIGEAMACGTPCVVTDVGDAALVLGDCGRVVTPGDSDALAAGLLALLKEEGKTREQTGLLARQRIISLFNPQNLIKKTQETMLNLQKPDHNGKPV